MADELTGHADPAAAFFAAERAVDADRDGVLATAVRPAALIADRDASSQVVEWLLTARAHALHAAVAEQGPWRQGALHATRADVDAALLRRAAEFEAWLLRGDPQPCRPGAGW